MESILAGSAAVILLAGPLLSAILLTERFLVQSLSARWAAIGVLWHAQVVASALALGHIGILTRTAASLLTLATLVAVWAACGRASGATARLATQTWERLRSERLRLAFGGIVLVLGLAAVRALLTPPLAWDSLTYHFYFAGSWVQERALVPLTGPDAMDGYAHFPKNAELVAAWLMLPYHSDLLANLTSFPAWLTLFCALYALGREFALGARMAFLLATSICLAPVVLAYVTAGYVDLTVTGCSVAAFAFWARFARARGTHDAALALVAAACAVGTKQTAMPLAFTVAALVLVVSFVRRTKPILVVLVAVVAFSVLAAPQYLRNLIETGNPVYPARVTLAGRTLFEGGGAFERAVRMMGTGKPSQDADNFLQLFSYWPVRDDLDWNGAVRAAGPKFAIVFLLTLAAIPLAVRRRLWNQLLAACAGLAPLVAFFATDSIYVLLPRRHWPLDTHRYFTVSLALCAAVAFALIARAPARIAWGVAALFAGFCVLDAIQTLRPLLHPLENIFFISLGACALLFAAWWLVRRGPKARHRERIVAAALAVVATCGAGRYLVGYRQRTRTEYFQRYTDLHVFPRNWVEGWHQVDMLPPQTIALATATIGPGHNWFYYPLMGSRLQHRVLYASISRRGFHPTHLDRGLLRRSGDYQTWLHNLESSGVTLVFVQRPWPIELRWILANKERFRPRVVKRWYALIEFLAREPVR